MNKDKKKILEIIKENGPVHLKELPTYNFSTGTITDCIDELVEEDKIEEIGRHKYKVKE